MVLVPTEEDVGQTGLADPSRTEDDDPGTGEPEQSVRTCPPPPDLPRPVGDGGVAVVVVLAQEEATGQNQYKGKACQHFEVD